MIGPGSDKKTDTSVWSPACPYAIQSACMIIIEEKESKGIIKRRNDEVKTSKSWQDSGIVLKQNVKDFFMKYISRFRKHYKYWPNQNLFKLQYLRTSRKHWFYKSDNSTKHGFIWTPSCFPWVQWTTIGRNARTWNLEFSTTCCHNDTCWFLQQDGTCYP